MEEYSSNVIPTPENERHMRAFNSASIENTMQFGYMSSQVLISPRYIDTIFLQVHKTVTSNIMISQVSSHRDYENDAIEVMFTTTKLEINRI